MRIEKLKDGGYLVSDTHQDFGQNFLPFLFASTTIEESLKYIKNKLEPRAK